MNFSAEKRKNKNNLKNNLSHLCKISNNNKIIYLPEEDTIFIDDNIYDIFGNKQYFVFKNGEYRSKDSVCLKDEFKD